MLPNFIVIGAGKAGSTSLWGYLKDHPEVFMSSQKELDFFVTERNWDRGLAWYESNFDDATGHRAMGEVSGNYTNWPEFDGVPQRMSSIVPDARLVYVIRHPIERIVSAYRYARVSEGETRPMDIAVRSKAHYLNASRYSTQIEQFLPFYPRDRLLVITSEDLLDDRENTMRNVFEFIGVNPDVRSKSLDVRYNRTDLKVDAPRAALRWASRVPGYHAIASRAPVGVKRVVRRFGKTPIVTDEESVMSDELHEFLLDALRDDVARLRVHLGSDFHCWGLA